MPGAYMHNIVSHHTKIFIGVQTISDLHDCKYLIYCNGDQHQNLELETHTYYEYTSYRWSRLTRTCFGIEHVYILFNSIAYFNPVQNLNCKLYNFVEAGNPRESFTKDNNC